MGRFAGIIDSNHADAPLVPRDDVRDVEAPLRRAFICHQDRREMPNICQPRGGFDRPSIIIGEDD